MRKNIALTGFLAYMLIIGIDTAQAQMVSLDGAINNTVVEFSPVIGTGTRVAVISMEAGSVNISNYIIDEMTVAFLRMGRFTVVDRAQLDLVTQELHFQMSGEVDDATAQSIGRLMGVQFIITGTFAPLGNFHRFMARLIEVETAAVRGIYTANVRHDNLIAALLSADAGAAGQATRARAARVSNYRLNWFSAELTFWGGGIRYERNINNFFSIGGNIFYDNSAILNQTVFGITGTARLYPGGFPLYLELGLGYGHVQPYYCDDCCVVTGFMVAPAIGARFGGRTGGFFAYPFISLPFVFEDGYLGGAIRFGIGLGFAW